MVRLSEKASLMRGLGRDLNDGSDPYENLGKNIPGRRNSRCQVGALVCLVVSDIKNESSARQGSLLFSLLYPRNPGEC